MKKIIFLALAAAGGYAAYRRIQSERAEQDLWTEATSTTDTR